MASIDKIITAQAENFNYDHTGRDSTKTDCVMRKGETLWAH